MTIKPPRWAANAIPTKRGWVVKGELIRSQRFTQEQIDDFYNSRRGVVTPPPPVSSPGSPSPIVVPPSPPISEPAPMPAMPVVDPTPKVVGVSPDALDSMTKAQLVDHAQGLGIEVNATAKKSDIVELIKQSS